MPRSYSLEKSLPTAHQRKPQYTRGDAWIRAFLHRGHIAHLATVWEQQPFVTPTNYYFDEPGHRLIFHSNVALEFGVQFRSVMVFGTARLVAEAEDQRHMLHLLIAKYFSPMELGKDYRPVTDQELKRTAVYELVIESWSGKENWKDQADQSDEWPALDEKWEAERQ